MSFAVEKEGFAGVELLEHTVLLYQLLVLLDELLHFLLLLLLRELLHLPGGCVEDGLGEPGLVQTNLYNYRREGLLQCVYTVFVHCSVNIYF